MNNDDTFKKRLETKVVGNIEYRLAHLIKDDLFVIYKFDKNVKSIQYIPEVFRSESEKDAREYLEKLGE